MKAVYTGEDECIADLRRKFVLHNRIVQSKVRISQSEAAGSTTIGFYRGRQAGIHDAYCTLRNKFPKAAAALLTAYRMDDDGSVRVEP